MKSPIAPKSPSGKPKDVSSNRVHSTSGPRIPLNKSTKQPKSLTTL